MLFFVSIYLCKLPSLSARQYNLFSSFYHILTDLMNHSFCLTSLHLLWPNISYSPTQWFWCCWCTLTFPLKPPHFSPPQTNWIHISSCLVIGFVFIQSNNYSTVCFFMIYDICWLLNYWWRTAVVTGNKPRRFCIYRNKAGPNWTHCIKKHMQFSKTEEN